MALALVVSVTPIALRLVGVIPDSWIGQDILSYFLLGDRIIAGTLGTTGAILVASMIADVVEETQVKTGRRSEGLLLSADNVLQKVVAALASVVPGFLLKYVGLPIGKLPSEIDPAIMTELALIYLPMTASFSALAILALTLYRIDKNAHEENLRKISEAAAAGETAAEAESPIGEGVTAPGKPS